MERHGPTPAFFVLFCLRLLASLAFILMYDRCIFVIGYNGHLSDTAMHSHKNIFYASVNNNIIDKSI
jgi:hypothetical protein